MINLDTPVLIVDDNWQYSQVLIRLLTAGFGYKTVSAVESVEEGLEVMRAHPDYYGILFIDYNFPGPETGGTLLEQLKEEKLLDGKIAFLVTSDPNAENVTAARRAGALGVLAKPFSKVAIREQLERAKRSLTFGDDESF